MSYRQYYGYEVHIKGGPRAPYRDYIMGPTKVPISDPCPSGIPVVLTGAHNGVLTLAHVTSARRSSSSVGPQSQRTKDWAAVTELKFDCYK